MIKVLVLAHLDNSERLTLETDARRERLGQYLTKVTRTEKFACCPTKADPYWKLNKLLSIKARKVSCCSTCAKKWCLCWRSYNIWGQY